MYIAICLCFVFCLCMCSMCSYKHVCSVCICISGGSRLSEQGAHNSETTFIVRSLHIKLHFWHLYTLKMQDGVQKMLSLAIPINAHFNISSSTYFSTGGHRPTQAPLKNAAQLT